MTLNKFVVLCAAALGTAAACAYETAYLPTEQVKLKIETFVSGLSHPWGITELPDGRFLVTERDGRLRYVTKDGKLSQPISGLPPLEVTGQGGLLDVLADKDFAKNNRIYFSFSEPGPEGTNSTAVASATLAAEKLNDVKVIFSQTPKFNSKFHFGGRLVQQANGELFITLGDRATERPSVQKLDTLIGKVAHFKPDGTAGSGNPYVTTPGANPLVWSYGHRNIQGATLDAQGRLWTHEHGPQGGDEINITQAGKNYGWPLITYGEEYGGGVIGTTAATGLEQPLHYWVPSIAPSGMLFYKGAMIKNWQGNLLVGSLKFGQLVRLEIKDDKVVHEERMRLGARIRDVEQTADGHIYLLTDEDNGAILRLTPAN